MKFTLMLLFSIIPVDRKSTSNLRKKIMYLLLFKAIDKLRDGQRKIKRGLIPGKKWCKYSVVKSNGLSYDTKQL